MLHDLTMKFILRTSTILFTNTIVAPAGHPKIAGGLDKANPSGTIDVIVQQKEAPTQMLSKVRGKSS